MSSQGIAQGYYPYAPQELYEALEASNEQNEITPWLMWFARVAIESRVPVNPFLRT